MKHQFNFRFLQQQKNGLLPNHYFRQCVRCGFPEVVQLDPKTGYQISSTGDYAKYPTCEDKLIQDVMSS